MKTNKYITYIVNRCNGDVEKYKVPRFFSIEDVQKALPHSLIVMEIPKNHSCITNEGMLIAKEEPKYVMLYNGELYPLPRKPLNDIEFAQMYRLFTKAS